MGVLDAPGVSRRQAQRLQLVPMATRCAPSFQPNAPGGLSDGIITGGTARLNHLVVCSGYAPRLVFSNHYASPAITREESGPNVITVKAALDYPDTYIFPVTFGGADSVEIAPGANVISDPIGLDFAKGVTFYSRTFVTVNAGEKFPRGGYGTAGAAGPTWHNYANPTGLDLTRTGSGVAAAGYNEYVFGPSAILGHPAVAGIPVIGIVGDSIASGTGDDQTGWPVRWLNNNYAHQKVAYPGEGVGSGWRFDQGLHRYRRYALLEMVSTSHTIAEYIVNDLGGDDASIRLHQLEYWTSLSRFGPVYATTCTPQTTTTDAWATLGNQTIADGARETKRVSYNTWLRDGAPTVAGVAVAPGINPAVRAGQAGHPLAGYLEVADGAESARNSGKWRVDVGDTTDDGTHPNPAGAAAIAAGLPSPTLYFGGAAT